MESFTLKQIDEIEGKQKIYKLEIDDKCLFDDFEDEIEKRGQYSDELATIYAHIEDFANNKTLPQTKFRILNKGVKNDKIKEYEFKSKHLRIYGIKAPSGQIIIMGGYKKTQKKDINRLKNIKAIYIKTL
ncbi:hypothetical protein [Prolixibacter sp. NT017]|uniref:hypothetical protein n=1 Tax=Prolixibacter sp. NT017 TaxID=2652390 RepID=UPI001286B6D3|nr:hypothetical protein [Prolixibacter sp. NT017]GET27097.1 hypothetical protein NT017_34260 [Prolixibacter sp. NT017]